MAGAMIGVDERGKIISVNVVAESESLQEGGEAGEQAEATGADSMTVTRGSFLAFESAGVKAARYFASHRVKK